MRTKDPDFFDRAKRAHFIMGQKLLPPTTLSAYGHIVSFEQSITSKMLAATSTLRPVLDTSVSLPVRIWDSSWWAAQHANPLPKPVLFVHRVTASDPDQAIDPASSASPLSTPVITRAEPADAPNAPP
jgi:hypothetical protein